MSNFDEAKSCLKKLIRLLQENSHLSETDTDQRKLNTGIYRHSIPHFMEIDASFFALVRKVIHYSLEVEAMGVEKVEEKMKICEKLGDMCCSIQAFPAAIKFYKQQV